MAEEDSTDHGIIDLKSEEELSEQMDDMGIQFRYGCYMDKIPIACHSLGQWLENYKRDLKQSTAQFKYNCDTHLFGESCLKYANRRLNAMGCEKDAEVALKYYLKGCEEAKHTRCCVAAGQLLVSGETSRDKDYPAAFNLFSRACSEGFSGGCTRAGALALQGKGFEQREPLKAFEFFQKACEENDYPACVNLSVMLKRGDGVPKDEARAREFREKAIALRKKGLPMSSFRPPLPESN